MTAWLHHWLDGWGATTARPREVAADGVVLASPLLEVSADAGMQETRVRENAADAFVVQRQTRALTADARISAADVVALNADAHVVTTVSLTTTGDALLSQPRAVEVAADASLGTDVAASVAADGVVEAEQARGLDADAHVVVQRTLALDVDGLVAATWTHVVAGDAAIAVAQTRAVAGDAQVSLAASQAVAGDGLVQGAATRELAGDGHLLSAVAHEVSADARVSAGQVTHTAEVAADGRLAFFFTNTRGVAASAVIMEPSATWRSVLADGYVMPWPEVSGDAIVTDQSGGGTLVALSGGLWPEVTWNLVSAERSDGTVFVPADRTFPYVWVPGFAADAIAVIVGVDLGSAGLGDLQIALDEEVDGVWTTRGTAVLLADHWSAYRLAEGHQLAWVALTFPAPVPLSSARWRVAASALGSPPSLLASPTWVGAGQGARVLNCLVVTNEPGTPDGRALMVAGSVGDTLAATTVTLDRSITASRLTVGLGGSIATLPTTDVTLALDDLEINAGGALVMLPESGKVHLVRLGSQAEINGAWTMAGSAKTHAVRLDAEIAASATSLTVDQAPIGWQAGDRLYLAGTSSHGREATVASVSDTTVTLTAPAGIALPPGSLVLNLSRGATVEGGELIWGATGTIDWSHIALRQIEGFACEAGVTIGIDHLLLDDCARLVLPAHVAGSAELAEMVLFRSAFTIQQGYEIDGTVTLAGEGAGIAVEGTDLTLALVAQDVAGACVSVSGGKRHTLALTVDRRFARPGETVVAIDGPAGRLTIAGQVTSTEDGASVCTIGDGGFLSSLDVTGLTSDATLVTFAPGAIGLGAGTIRRSSISAPLAQLDDETDAVMVDLVDLDGTAPLTAGAGSLAPGSRVANRDATRLASGRHQRSTTARTGDASLLIEADTDHTVELLLIPVSAGQTVSVDLYVMGDGMATLTLGETTREITATQAWTLETISQVATADGVLALAVTAHAGATIYIDDVTVS